MAEIIIRTAVSSDLPRLNDLDHTYSTEYVWQMETREEDDSLSVAFRQVHLPRPMRVQFPRSQAGLVDAWVQRRCFLVAEAQGQPRGYVNLLPGPVPDIGLVADFAVEPRFRRQGIGSALLLAVKGWSRDNGLRRLILETQTKNYPGISFCRKHGFLFSGYNDRYYSNMDIALFFGINLR